MSVTPKAPSGVRPASGGASRPTSASRRDYNRAWNHSPWRAGSVTPISRTQTTALKSGPPAVESLGRASAAPLDDTTGEPFLQLFADEALTPAAASKNHDVVFANILRTLADETQVFGSFAVACDAAMARAEVACKNIEHPRQLESSVAASLLMKLSPHLGAYAPLVHRLVVRLVQGTFSDVPASITTSSPHKLPTDGDFAQMAQSPSFGSQCKQLRLQLSEKYDVVERARNTLFTNTGQLFRIAQRHASQRMRSSFYAWRSLVKTRRSFALHLSEMRRLQIDRSSKQQSFMRWVAYVHQAKAARATNVSTSNNEKLSFRVADLTARCSQREEQMTSQRAAKEKYSARCDRLEELYAYEKEELAKLKAKLVCCEQEVHRFRQLAAHLFNLFDRLTATIPATQFTSSIMDNIAVHASMKRDLNIKKQQLPLKLPSTTSSTVSPKLLITNDFSVPFVVHGGGAACLEEYVDDVYLSVVRWVNESRDEVRQFIDSLRQQKLISAQDPFAVAQDEDDLSNAKADADASARTVRDLSRDLSDGRVYRLLLWRLLSHRYGGTAFMSGKCRVAPYHALDSNGERMTVVLKMAKLVAVDGGAKCDILTECGTAEARRQHFLMCCRLMAAQAACTPHFLQLANARATLTSSGQLVALTAGHVQQLLAAASERLDLVERWQSLVRDVTNYACEISIGSCFLETGSRRTPTIANDFLVDRNVILEQATPQHLRFAKPMSALLNPGMGNPGAAHGGKLHSSHDGGGDEGLTTDGSADGTDSLLLTGYRVPSGSSAATAAAAFLWSEINHLFAQHAKELQRIEWFYGCLTTLDAADCVWDTPAWFRFVEDTKLNANKHVPKQTSDAVFRALAATNPQSVRAAVVSLQPAQLQPRLSQSPSKSPKPSALPSAGKAGKQLDSTAPTTSGRLDDEDSGNLYQMPASQLPTAVVRLFLARSINSLAPQYQWTDVDRAVELFREFLVGIILAPSVCRSVIDDVVRAFNTPALQATLQQHKETLRRIFSELGVRDAATQLTRIRLDTFTTFVTKDLKTIPSVDASDVVNVYHTCRVSSMMLNPLNGAAMVVPGLDMTSFQVALMLLSRVKNGFALMPHEAALQQYFSTVVFPVCQFKFKLKL